MASYHIFYNSTDTTGQSQLVKAIGLLKYPTATISDIAGQDEATMATTITGLTDATYSEIVLACQTQATYSTTGKLTYDQVGSLIAKLITANQGAQTGTGQTGTCQTNAVATNIILAATASASNDTYNGWIVATTTGGNTTYHWITDYTGASVTCLVADTSVAVTDTSTYALYKMDHIYKWGDKVSNQEACRYAWGVAYASVDPPLMVNLMGGYGSGFQAFEKISKTATAIAAGTISDTTEFTANAYNGLNYHVGIVSCTKGAGQIRKVKSNTVTILTLDKNWDFTPTGTVVYHLSSTGDWMLYDQFLPLAIATYLYDDSAATQAIFHDMLDRYDDRDTKGKTHQDLATLDEYAERGKYIFQAKGMGVVS